ncbi:dihydrofolate reductase family protein [Chitinophaga pendula]|uniref:dihydrofolate reductase family protein n=1 Tax=Chitinophaga TaxID=79328 RepID=UPI000BAF9DFC|nr:MULTISPECIES: dihydrofolate reductase family protein [Chitinophaga]ASZ12591.1 dihydrofolate reductase [Chitinophaga sp. MD30]UCJ09805.1 dihydrofolate reductase family protein [Chitinophaga pendula]
MRKVVLLMHVSIDNYVADVNGGLDWMSYDHEMETYAEELVETVGMPLYGRVTYGMMAGYWPTVLENPEKASEHSLKHARWVQDIPKVVFSRTMESADWNNTRLIRENIAAEVKKLKEEPGKDLMIFGSPGLVKTFVELDLIDEYRLTIQPIALGAGIPLFKDMKEPVRLKLISTKQFKSGVIAAHYTVNKK